MIKRLSVISTAVLAAVLIAGLAWATPDDTSTSSTTSTTSTTAAATASQATDTHTFQAEAAGSVTVKQMGTSLSVGDVAPNSGWSPAVERASGREVEVKFINDNQRIDFTAELEDGLIKTRVRSESLGDSPDDGRALALPSDDTLSFAAGEAGTVDVGMTDGALTLKSANPNAGWAVADIELEGTREITVEFSNGTHEIEFKAELEDGLIKTRVRSELVDDSADDSSPDDESEDHSGEDHDSGHDDDSDRSRDLDD